MKTPPVKQIRCAIYTRVSTEQGLDREFNSLDAQYDAASAYMPLPQSAVARRRNRDIAAVSHPDVT
jgi:hypothetical protein